MIRVATDAGGNVIGVVPGAPAAAATCIAAAGSQAAVNQLANWGCYAEGTSVMTPPAPGNFCTMGRNTFRDFGFRNVDFSTMKVFHFGERVNMQFRAEFFNIFNHPQFTNPNFGQGGIYGLPNFAAGNFGQITSTSVNPRVIQLALKYIF